MKPENPYSASRSWREVKPGAILVFPDFVFPAKKKLTEKLYHTTVCGKTWLFNWYTSNQPPMHVTIKKKTLPLAFCVSDGVSPSLMFQEQEQGSTCSLNGVLWEQGTGTGNTYGPGRPARLREANIFRKFFLNRSASESLFHGILNQIFRGFIDSKNVSPDAEALKIWQIYVLGVK